MFGRRPVPRPETSKEIHDRYVRKCKQHRYLSGVRVNGRVQYQCHCGDIAPRPSGPI